MSEIKTEKQIGLKGKSVEYLEALEKLRLADQLIHLKDKAKLMGVESPTVLGDVNIISVGKNDESESSVGTPPPPPPPGPVTTPGPVSPEPEAKKIAPEPKKSRTKELLKKAAVGAALLATAAGSGGGAAYLAGKMIADKAGTTVIENSQNLGLEVETIPEGD